MPQMLTSEQSQRLLELLRKPSLSRKPYSQPVGYSSSQNSFQCSGQNAFQKNRTPKIVIPVPKDVAIMCGNTAICQAVNVMNHPITLSPAVRARRPCHTARLQTHPANRAGTF